jgi:hypothetical protein
VESSAAETDWSRAKPRNRRAFYRKNSSEGSQIVSNRTRFSSSIAASQFAQRLTQPAALLSSSPTSRSKAVPHIPCWRFRRPVTASRLYHRSCPPIATTCKLPASRTGESRCARLAPSCGIRGDCRRHRRRTSASHSSATSARSSRSRGRLHQELTL